MRSSRVLLFPLLLAPLSLGAQAKVDARRAVTPDASIRFSGGFASLKVIGWEHDSVAVTGTIGKGTHFEPAFGGNPGEPARGVKMFLDATEGLPTGRLELRVPTRARVWVKSGTADIEVSGVTGGLDLNIVGGSVTVSGTPRELNVESMDGNVTVDANAAWLRVKTATGDVTLSGGSEDAGANTVSGTIRVNGGGYERARFETVTGGIVYAGDIIRAASLHFETHSGPIEVRLPPKVNAEIDGMTVTGTIENSATNRRAIAGREGRGMEIGFEMGNGSGAARVVLRSFKGNITLRGR
jgi:hypothetical protein